MTRSSLTARQESDAPRVPRCACFGFTPMERHGGHDKKMSEPGVTISLDDLNLWALGWVSKRSPVPQKSIQAKWQKRRCRCL